MPPEEVLLLLRLVKLVQGQEAGWRKVAMDVVLSLDLPDEDPGSFSESYLEKLEPEAREKMLLGKPVRKEQAKMDTLARYCAYAHYEAFALQVRPLLDFCRRCTRGKTAFICHHEEESSAFLPMLSSGALSRQPCPDTPADWETMTRNHPEAVILWPEGEAIPQQHPGWCWLIESSQPESPETAQEIRLPYTAELAAFALDLLLQDGTKSSRPAAASPDKLPPLMPNRMQRAGIRHDKSPLIDTYFFTARLFPTLALCLPLAGILPLLSQFPEVQSLWDQSPGWLRYGGLPLLALAALYMLTQALAEHSKRLEERYFHQQQGFPSTYLLLYSHETYNGMSRAEKERIRCLIREQFNIALPDAAEEARDPAEARRRITDAMHRVRQFMKNGHLIYRQNVRYGANRVFLGAAWLGFLLSLVLLALAAWQEVYWLAGVALLAALLYGRWWRWPERRLRATAEDYARQLIMEFGHYG